MPLFFKRRKGEALEQVLLPREIGFHCTGKEALTKPSGSSQKEVLSFLGETIDIRCLIDINIATEDDLGECLNAYGVFF